MGRRCGRLRQPRHAALSRCRPESGSGPLGPGLPAGPAQRRVVRRKRSRPSATLSVAGSGLSWLVLGVWWGNAAAIVGIMPSLIVLVGLTLVMFGGHAWAHAEMTRQGEHRDEMFGFPTSASLGLVGHGFLLMVFQNPEWSNPPWPALGALLVMTLAASTTALFVGRGSDSRGRGDGLRADHGGVGRRARDRRGLGPRLARDRRSGHRVFAGLAVDHAPSRGRGRVGRCARGTLHRRADVDRGIRSALRAAARGAHAVTRRQPLTDPLAVLAAPMAMDRSGAVLPAWLATVVWQTVIGIPASGRR